MHVEIGNHENSPMSESSYDKMRREWAQRFATVDPVETNTFKVGSARYLTQSTDQTPSNLSQGWALSKLRVATRFTAEVKAYLKAKFELGEKTGLKTDPTQVSADMRNARDEENNRRFSREEWLTKSQIKSYFSRLASARRKGQATEDVDEETNIEDLLAEEEEYDRIQVINQISEEIGLCHPICYDVYDLCEYRKCNKLFKFVFLQKCLCFEGDA